MSVYLPEYKCPWYEAMLYKRGCLLRCAPQDRSAPPWYTQPAGHTDFTILQVTAKSLDWMRKCQFGVELNTVAEMMGNCCWGTLWDALQCFLERKCCTNRCCCCRFKVKWRWLASCSSSDWLNSNRDPKLVLCESILNAKMHCRKALQQHLKNASPLCKMGGQPKLDIKTTKTWDNGGQLSP